MPITQATPEKVAKYLCAAGVGTKEAMENATSPQGICEWIVNFFTCGRVKRNNEKCFREVVEKLTTALLHVNKDDFYSGAKIFLEDINGCVTSFSYGEVFESSSPMVTVEVSKNGKTVTRTIVAKTFLDACRMLKLMNKYNIQQQEDSALLTDEGKLDLRGANLTHKDFNGEDLSHIDASNADFRGSNLSDVNLIGANLCCANLHAVNLMGSNMTRANLTHANLTYANMSSVNLTAAILFSSDFTSTNLNSAILDKIALTLAKSLTGANLTGIQHTPTPLLDYNDETPFPRLIF
ncbi:SPI-2 type III secretion system effector PipB [Salmonella enterica subsp. enterica]|nr:effector protein PipB [Salmonella enterica subsp. arizonae serovar 53:-:- str. SA20100345]EBL3325574.1 type III secretion system effector PipB [Salmonella enterica subsp. enterica]ECX9454588.1 SPI-2 type III secretion system effector PipB [Salmonella enterica]EDR3674376.1 SPI-2 type III secretion system effector PipB [Salmonella enterica subsp. arizonae serovar 40:z4,z24:]ECY0833410.1 SPI-2 type III secretion system effector PipB [Salmonella enterica subsp. enterica]